MNTNVHKCTSVCVCVCVCVRARVVLCFVVRVPQTLTHYLRTRTDCVCVKKRVCVWVSEWGLRARVNWIETKGIKCNSCPRMHAPPPQTHTHTHTHARACTHWNKNNTKAKTLKTNKIRRTSHTCARALTVWVSACVHAWVHWNK